MQISKCGFTFLILFTLLGLSSELLYNIYFSSQGKFSSKSFPILLWSLFGGFCLVSFLFNISEEYNYILANFILQKIRELSESSKKGEENPSNRNCLNAKISLWRVLCCFTQIIWWCLVLLGTCISSLFQLEVYNSRTVKNLSLIHI